jgi:hypothetical protein
MAMPLLRAQRREIGAVTMQSDDGKALASVRA